MQIKPTIAIVLDTRRANKDNLYPVKLRATFQVERKKWKQIYFSIGVAVSKNDFKTIRNSPRSTEHKALAKTIRDEEQKANKIVEDNNYLTPQVFKRMYSVRGVIHTVGSVFNMVMREMLEAGRIGNYNLYKTTRNSIARFVDPTLEKMKTRKIKEDNIKLNISFYEIDQDWIKRYQTWLREQGLRNNIYFRHLRGVYNRGIQLGLVRAEQYPFGKKGYTIKASQSRKIALSEVDKNRLLAVDDPELKYAVDFWVLSYYCYGLNMLDIALLKISDVRNGLIVIQRHKKKNTDLSGKLLVVPVRDEVKEIISRHGNKTLNPDDYVFPILKAGLTPTQIKNRVNSFVGKINSDLKKVQDKLELDVKLTTYTARHTFANIALQKGASKEFIQDALGHSSIMTTENYLAGFDVETKKAISSKL